MVIYLGKGILGVIIALVILVTAVHLEGCSLIAADLQEINEDLKEINEELKDYEVVHTAGYYWYKLMEDIIEINNETEKENNDGSTK